MNTLTPTIKLIALDIDGTLLNSNHEISIGNAQALRVAMDRGIQVILATGKTFSAATPLIKQLDLSTPGVYLQGTATYNSDGTLRRQTILNPEVARRAITFAEERGFEICLYCGDRILVRRLTDDIIALTADYHEPMPEPVGPLQNMLDRVPVNKLAAVLLSDPARISALRWQFSMQFNGSGRLVQTGADGMLEVLPARVSKGSAVKTLIKELGVAAEHVLAIGDGENDVEMLQMAAVGVAMGNASIHVKEIADATVASNDEDGVAEAIERFALRFARPELALPVQSKK